MAGASVKDDAKLHNYLELSEEERSYYENK